LKLKKVWTNFDFSWCCCWCCCCCKYKLKSRERFFLFQLQIDCRFQHPNFAIDQFFSFSFFIKTQKYNFDNFLTLAPLSPISFPFIIRREKSWKLQFIFVVAKILIYFFLFCLSIHVCCLSRIFIVLSFYLNTLFPLFFF